MTFSENPASILAILRPCRHALPTGRPLLGAGEVGETDQLGKAGTKRQNGAPVSSEAQRRDPELPEEASPEAYEQCLPYYHALAAHTISPTA